MRNLFVLVLLMIASTSVKSQNYNQKEISSKVNAVTVFLKSAQITREKSIQLPKGITVLKFKKLSPFVNSKSIQVTSKDVEIQAVNFEKDFLDKSVKAPEIVALEKRLKALELSKDTEKVNLEILNDELLFMTDNRKISGRNETLNTSNFKETAAFYSAKIKELKLKRIKVKRSIKSLENKIRDIWKQKNEFTPNKDYASGIIVIKVKSLKNQVSKFSLSYNVSNAGWVPSYDIRVKNINSPLTIVYKANVIQNTKVNWHNVALKFSSANPNKNNTQPNLVPYFLDYGSIPPIYKGDINTVTGKVSDKSGSLPGVSVLVKGTTIGTQTDFDGNYSLPIPKNTSEIEFSYLGYKTVQKRIHGSVMNIMMEEDANRLDEVVVTAYGTSSSSVRRSKPKKIKIRGNSSLKYNIPTRETINQTSVDFEVIEPYSIKSDNKNYTVAMRTYETSPSYQYFSFPMANNSAFLVASLVDWEKYHMLEGEANIYFENTFIGKSIIDTRFAKKELKFSLGVDKNVVVSRQKRKNYTTRQFIGNKQEEAKAWDITIKNNKTERISMTVIDQIPITTREEIKITLEEIMAGIFDKKTGELKWNFSLNPKNTKKISFAYKVKYPKNRFLNIE